jgi:hypothetical protein
MEFFLNCYEVMSYQRIHFVRQDLVKGVAVVPGANFMLISFDSKLQEKII